MTLGRRGHGRLERIFNDDACVAGYRDLLRGAAVGLRPVPSSATFPDRGVSQGGLSSLQARRIVEARLGREPQDMLESAVALEAWAGVHAREALAHGRD